MSRIAIIQALLSQVEFEIDQDGVGVEFEDTNFYLYCVEDAENPENDHITLAMKDDDSEWTPETIAAHKVDLTSDELEIIFSYMQQLYDDYTTEGSRIEAEAQARAEEIEDTERHLDRTFYNN